MADMINTSQRERDNDKNYIFRKRLNNSNVAPVRFSISKLAPVLDLTIYI